MYATLSLLERGTITHPWTAPKSAIALSSALFKLIAWALVQPSARNPSPLLVFLAGNIRLHLVALSWPPQQKSSLPFFLIIVFYIHFLFLFVDSLHFFLFSGDRFGGCNMYSAKTL
jgi:hypothetical protein